MITKTKRILLRSTKWIFFTRRGLRASTPLCLEPGKAARPSPAAGGEEALVKHPLVKCNAAWSCLTQPAPYPYAQPRILIVGAGLAGLAAAWRLVSLGFKDIVVLEALDRPGGRVHTSKLGKTLVDLGSSAIYSCRITNPLYNIAIVNKVVDHSLEKKFVHGPYYTSDGKVVYDMQRPFEIFESAIEEAAKHYGTGLGDTKAIKDILTSKLKNISDEQTGHASLDDAGLVINGLENETRVRWGSDLESLSVVNFTHSEVSSTIIKLNRIGAKKLLEPFLSVVKDKIRYKKPVQSILWRQGGIVLGSLPAGVICCDGEELEADFVLCTISLGVLKAQGPTLFSPELPRQKAEAIDRIGFGSVNRIFVEYDPPFWAPSEGTIRVGWSSEELSRRDSWLKGIGAIEEVSPTVLGLSVAGKEAVWTESATDKSIAEELTDFLRKFTANPAIPCPQRIIRSRWRSDVFFNGAQSFLGLECSPSWQVCLGCPLPDDERPVLLFAGEATVPGANASMTGAVVSGLREADRLHGVCLRHRGPPRLEQHESLKPCPSTVVASASST